MASTENRLTIFTKNDSPVYGGRALVFDLVRSINHGYGSTTASHPVEGTGLTKSDHQYLKNIKIQFAAHVSNAVALPTVSEYSSGVYGAVRDHDSLGIQLAEQSSIAEKDVNVIGGIGAGSFISQEEADSLNRVSVTNGSGITYDSGDILDTEDLQNLQEKSKSNAVDSINKESDHMESVATDELVYKDKDLRTIYSSNRGSKQIDALVLLEAIRDNKLLVDCLTTSRLYENMTLNFNIPRNMNQGMAFEVNCVLEEQRFYEPTVQSVPYNDKNVTSNTEEGKKQGAETDVYSRSPAAQASIRAASDSIKAFIQSN